MAKNETGITDTGESENPMNLKARRRAYGHADDPQTEMGDGKYEVSGARKVSTNYGRPVMGPSARKRLGMR